MTRRETLLALCGVVLGAVVGYGLFRWSSAASAGSREGPIALGTADDAEAGASADASADPAMVANANLVESLRECSQRLAQLTDDESRIGEQLEAERMAEADASQSAKARRLSRRDPSQADWKRMAGSGTVRYWLPCASFNPTPEVLDRLGLAPADVPQVQTAFTAARGAAWAQIRPLCATAAGSAAVADSLGLDACPQVILDAAKTASPAAGDVALRAVGAVKAGLADPSTIPPEDPVGTAFLVLTGVAQDAERRLGAAVGPDEARAVVYGSGACGRSSEFSGAATR